jgi:hypothetical protein
MSSPFTDPTEDWPVKGLSQPARRALRAAGILTPRDLARFSRRELMALHGFGPKALDALHEELLRQGVRLRD